MEVRNEKILGIDSDNDLDINSSYGLYGGLYSDLKKKYLELKRKE